MTREPNTRSAVAAQPLRRKSDHRAHGTDLSVARPRQRQRHSTERHARSSSWGQSRHLYSRRAKSTHKSPSLLIISTPSLVTAAAAAEAAEEYVSLGSEIYLQEKRINSGSVLLKQYRNQNESIRVGELEKIKNILGFKSSELEVLENFSQSLTNKLTHEITTLIRSAIAENKLDLLAELKHLYKLESKNPESLKKYTENNDESV